MSTPVWAMSLWLPRFKPVTVIPSRPTQSAAMSVSPSQILPPDGLKACCGQGTLNSPTTKEKEVLLLHLVPGTVLTTPLQFGPLREVAPNAVPPKEAAAGVTLARLP